jgi:hypothetical protein
MAITVLAKLSHDLENLARARRLIPWAQEALPMSVWRSLAVCGLTWGLIVACGGGGGSTGTGGAGEADSFIGQYCDIYGTCCSKTGKAYDQAKCRALFSVFLSTQTYDPSRGQGCLDAARADSANASFCDSGAAADVKTQCNGVFKEGASSSTGTKQPGDKCDGSGECASTPEGEGYCATAFVNSATIKQCQIRVRGKEGDAGCVGNKDGSLTATTLSTSGAPPPRAVICWIEDGLFCDSKTKTCLKSQDVGGTCDTSNSSYACVKTAYCDGGTKKCVARKGLGDDCTSSTQCAEKSSCSVTKKCTAMLPSGAACTRNDECESKSCTNGKCSSSSNPFAVSALVCAQ